MDYKRQNVYTMKCRLYPNKECAQRIDNAIYAVQSYHNCLLYDIFNGNIESTPKPYTPKKESKPKQKTNESDNEYKERLYAYEQKQKYKEGDIIHFPNLKKAFSADYKSKLAEEHPIINAAPSGAITTNIGLVSDIKKSLGKNPIEFQEPHYYSKKKVRKSYTYTETFSKISMGDNENVFYINLAKIGVVKVRGWNKKIRFDPEGVINFLHFVEDNKKEKVGVKISKDNLNNYWICFILHNVFLPFNAVSDNEIGIDVGIKDLIITSDGKKFENKKFKEAEKKHMRRINRMLSRRWGWANEEFRSEYKKNKDITVSKSYMRAAKSLSKLHNKIAKQRELYNHRITKEIIENNSFIGTETLNVSGMFRNRHLANALSDAAMGTVLSMLNYKAGFYDRKIVAIDQWTPSSKRCSCCGYVLPKLSLTTREWTCPMCHTFHDRDINAAENVFYYAKDKEQQLQVAV